MKDLPGSTNDLRKKRTKAQERLALSKRQLPSSDRVPRRFRVLVTSTAYETGRVVGIACVVVENSTLGEATDVLDAVAGVHNMDDKGVGSVTTAIPLW